ncbi:MAG: YggS family pyridoxal phosphate-dependent enzyme [Oscillospiraceae bacterium]|jgi:pyridoxal phosphate enzyme (YggS family)|nr:YggS family pyridoxal phosphate-dependent enzyme [Oscillospiraceae bacterium]
MSIADNIKRVRERVAEAALTSGRDPRDITLVAAAKMNDAARVREAIRAGADAIGENRVQEMTAKLADGAYIGAPLHFIGHLQRNKVRDVVGKCDLIQSVGSAELLQSVAARAVSLEICQNVLIEVNIGRETQKSGFLPEMIGEALAIAEHSSNLRVVGLMAIPPADVEETLTMQYFDEMRNLFVDISAKKYDNIAMRILSMGMSADYPAAIRSGATMVRVGSAIFGARDTLQRPE